MPTAGTFYCEALEESRPPPEHDFPHTKISLEKLQKFTWTSLEKLFRIQLTVGDFPHSQYQQCATIDIDVAGWRLEYWIFQAGKSINL